MWRIKRRRTKPIENKAKTGVIYPKFNATAKQNRYVNRNTYLDVKCNRDKGAGCTIVGCQCQGPGSSGYPSQTNKPNITSFSDITNVADYKTRVNTIGPATFTDITKWYGPAYNLGTTYKGVYGDTNGRFSLPLPAVYNHISITYNNPHPGSGSDAVYIFIGGVGSGALHTENPLASQAVNEIKNGTTGASKTYSQRYQAGDYLKIQEKASAITTALVITLTFVPNIYCCKTTPYRNPILGYRKHLLDCSGNTDTSGCRYTNDVSGNVYKDNYAKSCCDPSNSLVCYNPVIKRTQNRNGCVNESYNYSTNQYLTRRCLTFSQQEFNFQSQVPVDASGCCTKFMSCANCQYDSSGMCDCSSNGFCTGINKLPCEVKNTKCFAIYKRSNPKFNKQGAVSGGSRINRLKYQTRVVAAQRRKANGRNNVINSRGPAALYTTSRPPTMNAPGCWLNTDRTKSGLAQRCIVTDPCCPTTSGGGGVAECWSVSYPSTNGVSQQGFGGGTKINYIPIATTYSNSNCSPGSHTTTGPSLIIELSNGPNNGWAAACNLLSYPENFIIYNSVGSQIVGGKHLGAGTSQATVVNHNPLQILLEIVTFDPPQDPYLWAPGHLKYTKQTDSEDPPICDSDELDIHQI